MHTATTMRRVIVGAIVLYLTTSLTLGGTEWAKPAFRLLLIAWSVVAFMVFRKHHHFAQPWRSLEIVFTNIAFMLALSEGVLRLYAASTGNLYWVAGSLDAQRLIPGQDYGHGLHGNRLGYPGGDFTHNKPAGIFRVAALGDSFAVGCAVPFAENYLTSLQRQLDRTEVYNFGVSGAGPREYLAILQQDAFEYQPDLVLVSVFVGNDITETLPTPRSMDLRGHALWHFGQRAFRLLEERRRRAAETSQPGSGGLSRTTFREIEARRLQVCLTPPSSSMEKKWQRCYGYLDAVVQRCRDRRIPIALVLIPDEFQVNNAVLQQALADREVRAAAINLDLPQQRLANFCTERGVPCLDLLPVLALEPACYIPQDTHWNVSGHRTAAHAIAKWLETCEIRNSKSETSTKHEKRKT